MEPLKIASIEMDSNPDLGELYMLINSDEPRPAISYLVDDEHNFYFRVEPETGKIVGAEALFANDWFNEIAEAFRQYDLNHPDVRFFLEQKVNDLARRLPQEMQDSDDNALRQETPEQALDPARP